MYFSAFKLKMAHESENRHDLSILYKYEDPICNFIARKHYYVFCFTVYCENAYQILIKNGLFW